MKNLVSCHDCGVRPGLAHERGCDVERCSACGGQRLQCECSHHDPAFARWTGNWPGALEADALGITLNDVAEFPHLVVAFFVKPSPDSDLPCRARRTGVHESHGYYGCGRDWQCPGWWGP